MKIAIMQPYFFPYIGYWQMMDAVDEYVIFDDVNYIKRGWMNRNDILFEGNRKRINIHIKDASQNRLIKDTKLAQTDKDNSSLHEIIKQSYHKAPMYEPVSELIDSILDYPTDDLTSFLANQIHEICNYLGMNPRFIFASEIDKDDSLKGEEKIISICKARQASTYVNAIGGVNMYHRERFKQENLNLSFLKTGDISYKQFDNEFVPNLSIIDVMMFNDRQVIKKIIKNYTLI